VTEQPKTFKPFPTHYVYVVVDADDPTRQPIHTLETRKAARRYVEEWQGKIIDPLPDGSHRVIRLRVRRAKLIIYHS
jgi:hypothetical protein